MSSESAKRRAKMKREDPEKYERYLEANRLRNKAFRKEVKRKWEEESHTRAQVEAYEEKKREKREREAERYALKKALEKRQTRTSVLAKAHPITPQKKRRRDLTEEERKKHDALVRKQHRDARSSQKKTADNMKQRQRRRAKKEEATNLLLARDVALTDSGSGRLPKKAYNLNHEIYQAYPETKREGIDETLHTVLSCPVETEPSSVTSTPSVVTNSHKRMRVTTKNLKSKPLCGCVAVVTGASSGIGQAVAEALAGEKVKVCLAARRLNLLEDIADGIVKKGGTAVAIPADVTDRTQVKNLIAKTESVLGPVSILVNCAGLMYYTMMKNLHEDEWERQVDVNCKGVLNGVGAVLDGMIQRGKGHIINISSNAGQKAFAGLAVYSGTKFFVEGMSQALRQEVAGTGVRVTCIQPGDVRTALTSMFIDREAVEQYDGSRSVKVLETQDVARAVVYAVSQPEHVAVNEILVEPREAPA